MIMRLLQPRTSPHLRAPRRLPYQIAVALLEEDARRDVVCLGRQSACLETGCAVEHGAGGLQPWEQRREFLDHIRVPAGLIIAFGSRDGGGQGGDVRRRLECIVCFGRRVRGEDRSEGLDAIGRAACGVGQDRAEQ